MTLNNKTIIDRLFFLSGLFAGMTCIGIYYQNRGITLFTLIQFLLVLSGIFLKKPSISQERIRSPFFGLIVCIFISPFINYFILPDIWVNRSFSDLLSNILGISSFYLLFSKNDIREHRESFVKGIKLNFIIQAIWSIVQFILGHTLRISLNYALGLYMPKTLAVTEVTGLTWERAELSLVFILGYIVYKNKIYMRFLAIVCLLLTGSRTALIMVVLLILFTLDYKKMLFTYGKRIRIGSIVAIIIMLLLAFNFKDLIWSIIQNTFISIANYKSNASGVGHLQLYENFIPILKRISIINILFGFSGGCSGYPYSVYVGRNANSVWSIESTVLSFFFCYGILGFSFWVCWMLKSAKACINNNEKDIGKLFIVILLGGLFYSLLSNFGLTALLVLSEIDTNIKEQYD